MLGNADDRLAGILYPSPGPPNSPEATATALFALSLAVFDGGTAAGNLLEAVFDWPPPNIVWAAERQPQRLMRPRSKSRWYRLAVGSRCPRYLLPMRTSP